MEHSAKHAANLANAGPEGPKHVIIVLAASEDPRLGGNLDSLQSLLAVSKARLFAIAITRGSERDYSFPVMTAQFLNQLAKDSAGLMFPGPWDAKPSLSAAR